ncbi:pirin family protein [Amycolatopsis sp.]|uniref:pirin family protein n=1 Tax=Amycolatopsis sp. TaxID=37632 RepID=UPI002C5F084B|nr:pirin family protein [Amycolatopsis sp.]HVV09838.1 pirin family protein [Amycolatopsis sp.]
MSNVERDPAEVVCVAGENPAAVEILEPREVPLGGPRALKVRRTLPQRKRSLVGAWCFVDSYGPTPSLAPRTMDTPPHPHTGLQTVSWLYAGRIEHRDSVGTLAHITPGQVNLMTAGAGIQHSEVSTADARPLHGVQLWVALPDEHRHVAPFFEHYVPEPVRFGDATLRVFVGELLGSKATVTGFTRLVGAQLDLPAGASVRLPIEREFEHGLVVDAGAPTLQGVPVPAARLGVVGTGLSELDIEAGTEPLRALLIGGEPLGERIVMWWNFVGRDHDEIAALREQWQAEVIHGGTHSGRFGRVDGYDGEPLPAPTLPNVRLRPRD